MSTIAKVVAAAWFLMMTTGAALAQDFSIRFQWGNIPLCTNGSPNRVTNPRFEVRHVPEGTRFIRFRLVDLDVPTYNHGGGVVVWSGAREIARGAFRYKSPCPPNGAHTYEWTATAQSKRGGGVLATAKARRAYPE